MEWYNNYIITKENYSEYIRNLIKKDLEEKHNPDFIKNQIKEHEEAIKQLKQLNEQTQKQQQDNGHKIQECLTYWNRVLRNRFFKTEDELIKEVERTVLPKAKKLGYTGSAKDIADLFLNWPKSEGG